MSDMPGWISSTNHFVSAEASSDLSNVMTFATEREFITLRVEEAPLRLLQPAFSLVRSLWRLWRCKKSSRI